MTLQQIYEALRRKQSDQAWCQAFPDLMGVIEAALGATTLQGVFAILNQASERELANLSQAEITQIKQQFFPPRVLPRLPEFILPELEEDPLALNAFIRSFGEDNTLLSFMESQKQLQIDKPDKDAMLRFNDLRKRRMELRAMVGYYEPFYQNYVQAGSAEPLSYSGRSTSIQALRDGTQSFIEVLGNTLEARKEEALRRKMIDLREQLRVYSTELASNPLATYAISDLQTHIAQYIYLDLSLPPEYPGRAALAAQGQLIITELFARLEPLGQQPTLLQKIHELLIKAARDSDVEAFLPVQKGYRIKAIDTIEHLHRLFDQADFKSKHIHTTFVVQQNKSLWRYDENSNNLKKGGESPAEVDAKFDMYPAYLTPATTLQEIKSPSHAFGKTWPNDPGLHDWLMVNQDKLYQRLSSTFGALSHQLVSVPTDARCSFVYFILKYGTSEQRQKLGPTIADMERGVPDPMCWIEGAQTFLPNDLFTPELEAFIGKPEQAKIRSNINACLYLLSTTLLTMRSLQQQLRNGYSTEATISMVQLMLGPCAYLQVFFGDAQCKGAFHHIQTYFSGVWQTLQQELLRALTSVPAKSEAESSLAYLRRSKVLFSKENYDLLGRNSQERGRCKAFLQTRVGDVIQHLSTQDDEHGLLGACLEFRQAACHCEVWTRESEKSLFAKLGERATTKLGRLKSKDSGPRSVEFRDLTQEVADTLRDYFSIGPIQNFAPQSTPRFQTSKPESLYAPYQSAFREFCLYYLEIAFKQKADVWALIEQLKACSTVDRSVVDACFIQSMLSMKVHASCVPDDLKQYDTLLSQASADKRAQLRVQMALAIVDKCSTIADWPEQEFLSLQGYIHTLAAQCSVKDQREFKQKVALQWTACLTKRYEGFLRLERQSNVFICQYEGEAANHLDLDCFFNSDIMAFIDTSALNPQEQAQYQTIQHTIARKYVELYCQDDTVVTDSETLKRLSAILGQPNFVKVLQQQLLWLLKQYRSDFKALKPRLDGVFNGLAKFAKSSTESQSAKSSIDKTLGSLTANIEEQGTWLTNILRQTQSGSSTVMTEFLDEAYRNQLIGACRDRKVADKYRSKVDVWYVAIFDGSSFTSPEETWQDILTDAESQQADPTISQSIAEYFVEQQLQLFSVLGERVKRDNVSAEEAFTRLDKLSLGSFITEHGTAAQQKEYQKLRVGFAKRVGDRLLQQKAGLWLSESLAQSGLASVADPQAVVDSLQADEWLCQEARVDFSKMRSYLISSLIEKIVTLLQALYGNFDQKIQAFLAVSRSPVDALAFFDNERLNDFMALNGSEADNERYMSLRLKIAQRLYSCDALSVAEVNFDPLLTSFPNLVAPRANLGLDEHGESDRDSLRSNSGGSPVNFATSSGGDSPASPQSRSFSNEGATRANADAQDDLPRPDLAPRGSDSAPVLNPILAAAGGVPPPQEKDLMLAHLRRFQRALEHYQRELNSEWRFSFRTDKRKKAAAELLAKCTSVIEAVEQNDPIRACDAAKDFFIMVDAARTDIAADSKSRLLRVLNEADCNLVLVDSDEALKAEVKACPTLFVYAGLRRADGSAEVRLYKEGEILAIAPLTVTANTLKGLRPNAAGMVPFLTYEQRRAIDPGYQPAKNIAPDHTKEQMRNSPWWATASSSRVFLDVTMARSMKTTFVSATVAPLQPDNDLRKYPDELVVLQRELLAKLVAFKKAIQEALRGYDGMLWDSSSKKARTATVAELTKQIDAISAQLHYQFTTIKEFETTAQSVKALFEQVDHEITERSDSSPLKKALQSPAATACRQAMNPWVVTRFDQEDGVQDLAVSHAGRDVFERRLLACSLYQETAVAVGGQAEVGRLWDRTEAEIVNNIAAQLQAGDFVWGEYAGAAASLKCKALKKIADEAQRRPVDEPIDGNRGRTRSGDLTHLLEKLFPKFKDIESDLSDTERAVMQGVLAPLGQGCLPYLTDRLKDRDAFVWPVPQANIPVNTQLQALQQAITTLNLETRSLAELEALEAAIQTATPVATVVESGEIAGLRQGVDRAVGAISDRRRALYLAENRFEFPVDAPAGPEKKLALLKEAVALKKAKTTAILEHARREGSQHGIISALTLKMVDFYKAYAVFRALGVADDEFEPDLIASAKAQFVEYCSCCVTPENYGQLFDASFPRLDECDQWDWLKDAWLVRKAQLEDCIRQRIPNSYQHLEDAVVAFKAQVDRIRAAAPRSEAVNAAMNVMNQGFVALGAQWVKAHLKYEFSQAPRQNYSINTSGQVFPLEASWRGLSAALNDEINRVKKCFLGLAEPDRASMARPSTTTRRLSMARVDLGVDADQMIRLTALANDADPLIEEFKGVDQYLRHAQQALANCASRGASETGQIIQEQLISLGALSVTKALQMCADGSDEAFYETIMDSPSFDLDMCIRGFQGFLDDQQVKGKVSGDLKSECLIAIVRDKGYPLAERAAEWTILSQYIASLMKTDRFKADARPLDPHLIQLAFSLKHKFTCDELFGLLNTIERDSKLIRPLFDRLTDLLVAEADSRMFAANMERLRLLATRHPWLLPEGGVAKQATHWPSLIDRQLSILSDNPSLGSIEFVKELIDCFDATTQQNHPLIQGFDCHRSNKACMNKLWAMGEASIEDHATQRDLFNSSLLKDHYLFLFNEAVGQLMASNQWPKIMGFFNSSIVTRVHDWSAMADSLRQPNVDAVMVEALLPIVLVLAALPNLPHPLESLKKIDSEASMTPRPSFTTLDTRESSFRYSSSRGSTVSTVDLTGGAPDALASLLGSRASSPSVSSAFDERKQAVIALLQEGFNKDSCLSQETRLQLVQQAMSILHGLCYVPRDLLPPDPEFVTDLAQIFTETNPERVSVLDREQKGCQKVCSIVKLFQQHQCADLTQANLATEGDEDVQTDDGYGNLIDTAAQERSATEASTIREGLEQVIQCLSIELSVKSQISNLFAELYLILKGLRTNDAILLAGCSLTPFDLTPDEVRAISDSNGQCQEFKDRVEALIVSFSSATMVNSHMKPEAIDQGGVFLNEILQQMRAIFSDPNQAMHLKDKVNAYNQFSIEKTKYSAYGAISNLGVYFGNSKKWGGLGQQITDLRVLKCEPAGLYRFVTLSAKPKVSCLKDYDFICVQSSGVIKAERPAEYYRVIKTTQPFCLEKITNLVFARHIQWPKMDNSRNLSGAEIASTTGFYPEEMALIEAAARQTSRLSAGANANEKVSYYLMLDCLQRRMSSCPAASLKEYLKRLKETYEHECTSQRDFYNLFIKAIEVIDQAADSMAAAKSPTLTPPVRGLSMMGNTYSTASTSSDSLNGRDLRDSVLRRRGSSGSDSGSQVVVA